MPKVRLSCDITPEVKQGLKALGLSIQHKKGGLSKAIRQCLERAYAAPDAPARRFLGEETENCSIEATSDEIAALHVYQDHHSCGEQRKGFKSALLRGFSLYLDEKEGSKRPSKKAQPKAGQPSA